MFKKLISLLLCLLIIAVSGCGAKKDVSLPTLDESMALLSPIDETGTLRIAVTYNDDTKIFNKAADLFQKKYPGWTVEVTAWAKEELVNNGNGIYSLIDDEAGETRYKNEIPDLLREGSVDVVGMDYLNIRDLQREGLLENLLLLFQEDGVVDIDMILPGIRDILFLDGGIYRIPVSFTNTVLSWVPEESLERSDPPPVGWTWDEMVEWFEADRERLGMTALIYETPESFTLRLYHLYAYAFADSENDVYDFNSPVFRDMLSQIKSFKDKGLLVETTENGEGLLNTLLQMSGLSYKVKDYTTLATRYGPNYPLPVLRGTDGMAVTLKDSLAVNANANEKTAAWEYIKILLSEEIQNSESLFFQPIISELSANAVNRCVNDLVTIEGSSATVGITDEKVSEYNRERFKYFSGINRVYEADKKGVYPIIEKHASLYYKDEITIDECIELIQKEVDAR